MTTSFNSFMQQILDYAGLFPPAKLPMDQAIRNYARYRWETGSWMLGRFICPAARLAELTACRYELFFEGEPFQFSALGRGGETGKEFLENLERDLDDIAAFVALHKGRTRVEVYECRLPAEVMERGESRGLRELMDEAANHFDRHSTLKLTPFFEGRLGEDWRKDLRTAIHGIAVHNASRTRPRNGRPARQLGFKVRCGGVEASAFPTAEQLAAVLAMCREAGLRLKATAGLHHPVRRNDVTLGVKMHGFLNLFGAGVLSQVHNLSESQLCAILEDEDPCNFAFTTQYFSWQSLHATPIQVTSGRVNFLTSYGSCSFDEPRLDLESLGYWNASGEGRGEQ